MNITANQLNMTYPNGKCALQNVSLTMESPSFIGLLGPNGAGKSTLMKLLVASLLPTEGEILLDGRTLKEQEQRLKGTLGYLPQIFGLYEDLTIWQFLDYMAALKGLFASRQAIKKVLEATNLVDLQRKRIGTLSGGQWQRVGIAQALLGNPQLLIFDEPTVGLDPEERIRFRNLFSQMAQDKIVLLSTHIIEDVQSVCNRLLVMQHGQLLFDGLPEQLIQLAYRHVGIFEEQQNEQTELHYQVTARINTARGISCRIVAEELPSFAAVVEPTLEDAYMYLIGKERKPQ